MDNRKSLNNKLLDNTIKSILISGSSGQKIIFVSGPYRGKGRGECEILDNIRRAEALAIKVWRSGGVCICPHLNTAFFGGRAPDNIWLKGDLEIVSRCDALIMISGWKKSTGAQYERKLALKLKKPVFYSIDKLRKWLKHSAD